jgi:hypothetical protein
LSVESIKNIKKIKFQRLRRAYDVPSWSRIVHKGTAPKGAPNLTANPNRVVVKLYIFEGGLDLVIVGLDLTMPKKNLLGTIFSKTNCAFYSLTLLYILAATAENTAFRKLPLGKSRPYIQIHP